MKITAPGTSNLVATVMATQSGVRDRSPLSKLIGQVIKADVLKSVPVDANGGNAQSLKAAGTSQTPQYLTTLQVGGDHITVATNQPLAEGTSVSLQVTSETSLQIVAKALSAPEEPDAVTSLLNTVLRQALPLQKPITDLLRLVTALIPADAALKNHSTNPAAAGMPSLPELNQGVLGAPVPPSLLAALSASPGITLPAGMALPPDVERQIQQLLNTLLPRTLTPDSVLTPGALQRAVAQVGLFREHHLLNWITQSQTAATNGPQTSVQTQPPASLLPAQATAIAQQNPLLTTLAAPSTANTSLLTPDAAATGTTSVPNPEADIDALRNQVLQAIAAHRALSQANTANVSSTALAGGSPSLPAAASNIATPANPSASVPSTSVPGTSASGKQVGPAMDLTQMRAPLQTPALGSGAADEATDPRFDTKTLLEQLVSVTARQLLRDKYPRNAAIDEATIITLLRSGMPQANAHAAPSTSKQEDNDWLMQLLRSGFGALKHLQLQQATQLASSSPPNSTADPAAPMPLQIELPIMVAQQPQSVHLEIERRSNEGKDASEQAPRAWRVTLRFELPDQGIIVAQLNIAGDDVNATLWAERKQTCETIKQQLAKLGDALRQAGANVTAVEVRHGQPANSKTRVEKRLIDIRT
jgi:hypothetical protein